MSCNRVLLVVILTSASKLLWNINVTNNHGYILFAIITIPSFFQSWLMYKSNTMGATSAARIDYFSGTPVFIPGSMRWPYWSIIRFLCSVIDLYLAYFLLSLVLHLLLRITLFRLMIYYVLFFFNSESTNLRINKYVIYEQCTTI